MTGKHTALTQLASDIQDTAMSLQRMFDDRKTKSRASRRTRAPWIYAIEALGQARQMLRSNAYPRIRDREMSSISVAPPAGSHFAALGRVFESIPYQI